jgi:hypothetical protein
LKRDATKFEAGVIITALIKMVIPELDEEESPFLLLHFHEYLQ